MLKENMFMVIIFIGLISGTMFLTISNECIDYTDHFYYFVAGGFGILQILSLLHTIVQFYTPTTLRENYQKINQIKNV